MREMEKNDVKVRKVGNSKVFTIPKYINTSDDTYTVFQGRHGDIIYRPKKPNIFKNPNFAKTHDLRQTEEWSDTQKGEEEID